MTPLGDGADQLDHPQRDVRVADAASDPAEPTPAGARATSGSLWSDEQATKRRRPADRQHGGTREGRSTRTSRIDDADRRPGPPRTAAEQRTRNAEVDARPTAIARLAGSDRHEDEDAQRARPARTAACRGRSPTASEDHDLAAPHERPVGGSPSAPGRSTTLPSGSARPTREAEPIVEAADQAFFVVGMYSADQAADAAPPAPRRPAR